jgi:hypothetical protein
MLENVELEEKANGEKEDEEESLRDERLQQLNKASVELKTGEVGIERS